MKKCINGKMIELTLQEIEEIQKFQKEYEQTEEYRLEKIKELKEEISNYDYIGIKIAMGVATKEEYADKIAYTEELRKKIRELEEM